MHLIPFPSYTRSAQRPATPTASIRPHASQTDRRLGTKSCAIMVGFVHGGSAYWEEYASSVLYAGQRRPLGETRGGRGRVQLEVRLGMLW
ncbi:hypothetical protein E2C01_101999 [Portunus trituberculatus]|uniref:Uncharacterized protein n=1 Tax=Portunus trituberculatus TaxID=210409 RepID=A0A5B7KN78_PORTR|nr:hypothetical protein [Portunus trituberculatus]